MPKKGKNVLALMLGGKPPKGKEDPDYDESDESDDESDYGEAFEEAAEATLQAILAEDSEGFASSLKDAIELCLESREE